MTTVDISLLFPKHQLLTPEDGQLYENAIKRWSETAERRAKYVVLPDTPDDVSKAIRFASENNLDLAIKGGGHSCSGASSSEDIVIDLGRMNKCTVDLERNTIKVGGGALWIDVDTEAAKYGMACVGGTVNHTGVGGLTVGGGYGWLTPKYGLVIDVLQEAEVVVANGDILTCSESQNTDLFWGIRGAGSNFGPVTSFTFKLFPQPNPIWSGLVSKLAREHNPAADGWMAYQLVYPPPLLGPLFNAAGKWAKTASEDESAMIFMACPPPAFTPALVVIPFFNGTAEEGKKKFAAFYEVGPVVDMTEEMPYCELNGIQNPMATYGDRKMFKSTAFTAVDPGRFQHIFDNFVKLTDELPETKTGAIIVELHPFDKVVSVPDTATAFANRGKWYNINCSLRWKDPALDKQLRDWANEQVEYLREGEAKERGVKLTGRRGVSSPALNYGVGDEKIRDVFGENYDRLTELKNKYDTNGLFHKWFAIPSKT